MDIVEEFSKKVNKYLDDMSKKINKSLEEKKVEAAKKMFNVVDLNEKEKEQVKAEPEVKNETKNEKVSLSSPWMVYVHKFRALFGQDPELNIMYDEDNIELKVRVDSQSKYEALSELLPSTVEFGNITLKINLIPSNEMAGKPDVTMLIADALHGNPVFDMLISAPDIFSNRMNYVMFKKEVVQYFCDNMADPNGKVSTLYQDIAEDILGKHEGINYCTSAE